VPDVVSPEPGIAEEAPETGEGDAEIRGEAGIGGIIDVSTLLGQGEFKGGIERVVHEHRS
jgi:hypothetical protein